MYKKEYKDIDVFVVSRSKKAMKVDNKKVKITIIDFNDISSLLYHSISKSCVAKNILPRKPLKVTMSDYWHVVNEAVPTILNQKNAYRKEVRFLVLYTEYFRTGEILDTFQLDSNIRSFMGYKSILHYIKQQTPAAIVQNMNKSYLKRFFYTQAGVYKGLRMYDAQDFLYKLTHSITRGLHG